MLTGITSLTRSRLHGHTLKAYSATQLGIFHKSFSADNQFISHHFAAGVDASAGEKQPASLQVINSQKREKRDTRERVYA